MMNSSSVSRPTVEWIWDHLSEENITIHPQDRKEKFHLVFPDSFCAEAFSRSPSYLSWFLHRTPQAKPLCERLYAVFSEDTGKCLREMSDKCLLLVYQSGVQRIFAKQLLPIKELFARSLPDCFGAHTKDGQFLEALCFRAPARALSLLFLLAGTGSQCKDILKKAALCWQSVPGKEEASPRDLYRLALSELRNGQKSSAFELLRDIIGNRNADKQLLGEAHLLLGNLYRFGEGIPTNAAKAEEHWRAAFENGSIDACYSLFEHLANASPKAAVKWLISGAEHGQKACQYELGKAYFEGSALVDGERNLAKAEELLTAAAADTAPDTGMARTGSRGHSAARYLLSKLLFEKNTAADRELALFYLTRAAKDGNEDARKELLHLYQESDAQRAVKYPADSPAVEEDSDRDPAELPHEIIINSLSAQTIHLLTTQKDESARILLCGHSENEHLPEALDELPVETYSRSVTSACGRLMSAGSLPRITVLLLDDDDRKNFADAQNLLTALKNQPGRDVIGLSKKMRIFLKAGIPGCAALVDSLLGRLSPFFVPLYLLEPGKLAAEQLLDAYPLFLPHLPCKTSSAVHVTTIGSGPSIPWLLRDALTLIGSPHLPFTVSCLAKDASLENAFFAECPAYADAGIAIPRVQPVFFSLGEEPELLLTEAAPLEEENQSLPPSDKARALAAVFAADYIVIDTGEDLRNLKLGMKLREMLLQKDVSFRKFPYIAIYTSDPTIASLAETTAAGNEAFGFSWYNNYNLIVYGPGSRLGDWEHVVESRLEKRARALHLRYCGLRNRLEENDTAVTEALQSYYSRQYNQDSSHIAALYAIYALAEYGIFWPSPEMYALLSDQTPLAKRYLASVKAPLSSSSPAVEREHDRWTRFMMTRGWQRASRQQVLAYTEKGNPRSQLYIAKLHPLICSWEELGDGEPSPTGMQAFYEYLMPRLHPGKAVPSLKAYDQSNVEAIPELLGIF